MPTFFIARPSKMHPNLDFWFKNKPSGIPGPEKNFLSSGVAAPVKYD
jgi:hypothetical protein